MHLIHQVLEPLRKRFDVFYAILDIDEVAIEFVLLSQINQIVRSLLSHVVQLMLYYERSQTQHVVAVAGLHPASRRRGEVVVRKVYEDVCDSEMVESVVVRPSHHAVLVDILPVPSSHIVADQQLGTTSQLGNEVGLLASEVIAGSLH